MDYVILSVIFVMLKMLGDNLFKKAVEEVRGCPISLHYGGRVYRNHCSYLLLPVFNIKLKFIVFSADKDNGGL